MPTSNIDAVPIVLKTVRRLKPTSILDIGIGFGKYGLLFREYLDVQKLQNGFSGVLSDHFSTRIDGIEIFDKYISTIQRNIYNNIYIGDAAQLIERLESYDVVFLSDIIEHFEKTTGHILLKKCVNQR